MTTVESPKRHHALPGAPVILRWGFMPPEVRAAVRPLLLHYLWILPAWIRVVGVVWKSQHDSGPDVDASCDADPEYLQGRLVIHSGWLEASPTQRRLDVVHELVHIPLAPIVQEQLDTITRLFEDGDAPKFRGKLEEYWRRSYEMVVQSLAYSILELPEEALPARLFVEEENEP